jgi:hypothetical protein
VAGGAAGTLVVGGGELVVAGGGGVVVVGDDGAAGSLGVAEGACGVGRASLRAVHAATRSATDITSATMTPRLDADRRASRTKTPFRIDGNP